MKRSIQIDLKSGILKAFCIFFSFDRKNLFGMLNGCHVVYIRTIQCVALSTQGATCWKMSNLRSYASLRKSKDATLWRKAADAAHSARSVAVGRCCLRLLRYWRKRLCVTVPTTHGVVPYWSEESYNVHKNQLKNPYLYIKNSCFFNVLFVPVIQKQCFGPSGLL